MRYAIAVSILLTLGVYPIAAIAFGPQVVPVGFNYPLSGPYADEGRDQARGARLAAGEINAAGGILNHRILLVERDSAADPRRSRDNVTELLAAEGVQMVFGGSSSAVAQVSCELCQQAVKPFFATLAYGTANTDIHAHRACFRESYNSWMAARVMADYLTTQFAGRPFFYITADYSWGHSTEEAMRELTGTTDHVDHRRMATRLGQTNFIRELKAARDSRARVIVLVLFGQDLVNCLRQATVMGLKTSAQIVVPNMTLTMARGAGPKAIAGVLGAIPWAWTIPSRFNFPKGKDFVTRFKKQYHTLPSSAAASAYTILYEYRSAVERAGTFHGPAVIRALEGHHYRGLKDDQQWRAFDHQSLQSAYMVRGKSTTAVRDSGLADDYFEILHYLTKDATARSYDQWRKIRENAGLPAALEPMDGDPAPVEQKHREAP